MIENDPDPQATRGLWNNNLSLGKWRHSFTIDPKSMSELKPSSGFLFFTPSWEQERLYVPVFVVLFVASFLYLRVGLSYALFLSPIAFWLAAVALIVASSAGVLLALNVYWAYEGNLTRRQKRPHKSFKGGSKRWCVLRHCLVALLCAGPLNTYFHEAIPHALLHLMGNSVMHELVVDEKKWLYSKYKRSCANRVVARSPEYRSDNLCLESSELYAEINVGDILVVEGKANWIGLLVDKPVALRNAGSDRERLVQSVFNQEQLVKLDATWQTP